MSARLKELQHYPISSDAEIDAAIAFVDSLGLPVQVYPPWANTVRRRNRYIDFFGGPGQWTTHHPAAPAPAQLIYTPRENHNPLAASVVLDVVRPADKQQAMRQLYDDPAFHTESVNQWYAQVTMHFLNITRAESTLFLQKKR